jgi:hypothetical protein
MPYSALFLEESGSSRAKRPSNCNSLTIPIGWLCRLGKLGSRAQVR